MGILRADRITGLGGANAIDGSTFFSASHDGTAWIRYIDAGVSDDFNFGTGDFTVECWINRTTLSNDDAIWATTAAEGSSSLFWYFNSSGHLRAYLGEGTSERASSSNNIIVDRWYHVALTRASGTVNMWVDGVSKYSDSNVTANIGSSTQNFIIGDGNTGYSGNAYMFLGYISNLRIQKGKAEYTAAFTPPTTRLAVTPETVLLACHDPGNVLAEATGKKLSLVQSGATGSNSAGIVASRFTPNSPVGFSTTSDVGGQYGSTFDGFGSFATSTYMIPPGGNTRERNRGRALYAGGYKTPNTITAIDSLEIQSGGLVEQFGDLSTTQHANCSTCSSSTRMVTNGGWTGSANNNIMEFVTIANSSNSTDFGDLAVGRRNNISASNQTRGLVYGGNGSPANTAQVDFFTIATTGNAADFGDASSSTALMPGAGSSTTRALFAGGYTPSASDTIDYFTIASTGDATDFGNLVSARKNIGGLSSSTRTLFCGGGYPSAVNSIDYVTTATTGNAQDFGDLTLARGIAHGTSNQTRGIFMGGSTNPARQNTIDFVIIAVTSDAIDFGDLRTERQNGGVASDSHGGL